MRLLVVPNFRQRSHDTMVTAMSPHLDKYPFDKYPRSGKRIHGSNIAANQHYSYGVRHSIGYMAPGLVDASVSGGFISIDPIILRGQSVRTSTKAAFVVVLLSQTGIHSPLLQPQ